MPPLPRARAFGLALAAAGVPAAAAAPAAAAPPVLTRTTPLTPTGELVAPGDIEQTMDVTGLWHELAVAPAHRLELRLAMPGLPVPVLGGDLAARVSVLAPDAAVRVVIGAEIAGEWMRGADLWLGASITAAYRGRRWSVHATARTARHLFETGDQLYLWTAGAVHAVGATGSVFVDIGELAWRHPTCAAPTPPAARAIAPPVPACTAIAAGRGVAIGGRMAMGADAAVGVSVMIVVVGDTIVPIAPALSFSWNR